GAGPPSLRRRISSATSAASCSRSRWCSSSRRSSCSASGKRRRNGPKPLRCKRWWCMSPPLSFVTVEKRRDLLLRLPERVDPAVEQLPAVISEAVGALGGAGEVGAPFGVDDPLGLEGAQEAVKVAHVDALAPGEVGKQLDQLVAVPRLLPEQQQQRRL